LALQGLVVAESIGAQSFYECPALMCEGVKEVFYGAFRPALLDVTPSRPRIRSWEVTTIGSVALNCLDSASP